MFTQTRVGWKRSRDQDPRCVRALVRKSAARRVLYRQRETYHSFIYLSTRRQLASTTLRMRQEFNGPRESKPMAAGEEEFFSSKQRCGRVWKFAIPFACAVRDLPCEEIRTWNVFAVERIVSIICHNGKSRKIPDANGNCTEEQSRVESKYYSSLFRSVVRLLRPARAGLTIREIVRWTGVHAINVINHGVFSGLRAAFKVVLWMATKVERISRARCSYIPRRAERRGLFQFWISRWIKGAEETMEWGGHGARSSAASGRWLPSTPPPPAFPLLSANFSVSVSRYS